MYPSSPWRGETAASRDGNSGRVPRIIQSSNEQHSQVSVTFVTFTHPERLLILGSGCKDDAFYNVQGSISRSWQISGQCEQSGSRGERAWKILNIGQDLSEESSTPGKGLLWVLISMIYYVSIITLTWRDSCIKRWQFWTSTLYHPKFEWATLPSFRHFRHLHSSWKGFDSGIRMQGWCLLQCSGVHQQVLADEWSVQTIWIARWKGINIFEHRPGSFERVFNTFQRACEIWYWLIMMNRWAIMHPWSPWRGKTAAPINGNFRRVPRIIQSSNEQHSQVSVTFVTFTHPERLLILGSGCKDIALYNVQGSISRSWQISGQCKQSGSRGERA